MIDIVQFNLNGEPARLTVDGERKLLWVLRSDLGVHSVKYGCGVGVCGACTVLVNNEAVRSCQLPVREIQGQEVMTIEGLSRNENLHPLQRAFIRFNALQCGYCTSGQILNAYSLLMRNPQPTREEIIEGMEDNLCRCGTYSRIIEAIQTAAQEMRGIA